MYDTLHTSLTHLHPSNPHRYRTLKEEHAELDKEHTAVLDEINDLMSVNQELRDEIQELRDAADESSASSGAGVRGLGGLESLSAGAVRTVELEDELKAAKRELAHLRASEAKARSDARARERTLKQEVDGLKQNVNDLAEEVSPFLPQCAFFIFVPTSKLVFTKTDYRSSRSCW